jgi:uncharacterized protein with von Willebrand factor type A (vWA) domain
MDLRDLLSDKSGIDDGTVGTAPVQATPTKFSLHHDEWSQRRGSELFQSSEELQGIFSAVDGDIAETATTDFRGGAFEYRPKQSDNCTNPRLAKYMQALMDTEEFRQLRTVTVGDENASEIAALKFSSGFAKVMEQVTEEQAATDKGEVAIDVQAVRAAMDASQAIDQYEDVRDSLPGMGGDPAGTRPITQEAVAGLFGKIRKSSMLMGIMRLAGRYRRIAQSAQRRKVPVGIDDVVGVHQSGDIGKLLPSELGRLSDPMFEDDTMRRIVENAAQCREHCGNESVGKGPIVVIVDETGSMTNNDNIYHAKAFALSLYWVASSQKRWCCLVGYAGEGMNVLVIPPGANKTDQVLEWLEHFENGATSLCIPVDKLPAAWSSFGCPKGQTDIVQITDAICRIPAETVSRFNTWKKQEQIRFLTIVIAEAAGEAAKISDDCWVYNSMAAGSDAINDILRKV